MPYKRIEYRDLNMFYVMNPDPREFAVATHDNLPQSHPYKPQQPTIVFVHAAGANVTSWSKQMGDPRLAQGFNLFAMDCRFNGWTTGGERKSHTLENSAECVLATLESMEFPSFSIYGEGPHGAAIAAWIACKRPDLVQSLVLASPGWMKESPLVSAMLKQVEFDLLINKPETPGEGDGTGAFPAEACDAIAAYFIGSSNRLAPHREAMKVAFEKRYGAGHSAHDVHWLFEAVRARKPIPQAELAKIRCPVLLLRGAEDTMVCPLEACEEWQSSFTNAKGGAPIHAIASAPSLISLSDSNIVNRMLLQFVQRSIRELFWVLNPIPQHLTTDATPDSIQSRGLNVDLPLLVFIHAAGSNVLGWQRQLLDPRLSARYNLLLIDCPFHGFSKAEERTEHTLEDSATCVVSVLDELNLGPFALYAEGVHGCTIATWIALKRPEKVQGLLLASPGWRTEDPAVKQSLVEVEQAMFVNKGDGKDGTLPDQSLLDITHYCI
ncbi:hypothetical protein JCM8547_001675 [Rhodosporidiobolus lusitaniae]